MNDKISIGQYSKVADDVKFGKEVLVYSHVNLYGCEIQDFTKIGTFVEIQKAHSLVKIVKYQVIVLSAKEFTSMMESSLVIM